MNRLEKYREMAGYDHIVVQSHVDGSDIKRYGDYSLAIKDLLARLEIAKEALKNIAAADTGRPSVAISFEALDKINSDEVLK